MSMHLDLKDSVQQLVRENRKSFPGVTELGTHNLLEERTGDYLHPRELIKLKKMMQFGMWGNEQHPEVHALAAMHPMVRKSDWPE